MNALLNIPQHTGCKNCGDCCGVIPCTHDELHEIQDYVKRHPEISKQIHTQKQDPMVCPFRDNQNKKCLIYPVRPVICRLMGVTKGMCCKYGNSAEIDGRKFVHAKRDDIVILNHCHW